MIALYTTGALLTFGFALLYQLNLGSPAIWAVINALLAGVFWPGWFLALLWIYLADRFARDRA